MLCFIVKRRSQLKKTTDGCGFVERGCCKEKKKKREERMLRLVAAFGRTVGKQRQQGGDGCGGRGRCFTGKVEMARLDSVIAIVASRGLLLLLTTALWLRPVPEEADDCIAVVSGSDTTTRLRGDKLGTDALLPSLKLVSPRSLHFIVDSSPSTVATSASATDGTNEISTDLPASADTVA
ncbi:hypothetical protein BHM03_00047235, partial [Ensete ventricosum]